MTSENAAPAEMPGEREVARAIATFRKHLYPDTKIDVLPSELAQAAAVLALFAPILAEKERRDAADAKRKEFGKWLDELAENPLRHRKP